MIKFTLSANTDRFWGVFWVDVNTPSVAEKGFVAIANKLGSAARSLMEAREKLANTKESWLLILDNADDPGFDYQVYFPAGTYGSVIMTSRVSECAQYNTAGSEVLEGLESESAIKLLLRAANIPETSWPSYNQQAEGIIKLLGSHTLALIQAGAFVAQGYCKLEEYTSVYRRQRDRLLKFQPKQGKSRYCDVYTTFEASAGVLEISDSQAARDALRLLDILSIFYFSSLPFWIFEEAWEQSQKIIGIKSNENMRSPSSSFFRLGNQASKRSRKTFQFHYDADTLIIQNLDPWHVYRLPRFINVQKKKWNPYRLQEAISLLASLSLLTKDESLALSMHPLTHAWARDRQSIGRQDESWISAGCILAMLELSALSSTDNLRLQAHILAFLDKRPQSSPLSCSRGTIMPVLVNVGWILFTLGEDQRLTTLLQDIFRRINMNPLVPELESLKLYELQAADYGNTRKKEESLKLYKQILHIIDPILPKEHEYRQAAKINLAANYTKNYEPEKAIELLEPVFEIQSTSLAEDHWKILR